MGKKKAKAPKVPKVLPPDPRQLSFNFEAVEKINSAEKASRENPAEALKL